MAGLDGVDQPRNRLLVPGKRNVGSPLLQERIALNPQ